MEGYRPAIARRWLGGIVILLAGAVCLAAAARLAIRIHWDPALAALAGQPHAPDFGVFLGAADDVLHGRNLYAGPFPGGGDFGYVYPPLLAVLMSPLALVPTQAVASWGPFLLACILGSLMILGVRDWRCYAIAAVSPFTRSALEYGAIGPVLVLLVALTWRFRDAPPSERHSLLRPSSFSGPWPSGSR